MREIEIKTDFHLQQIEDNTECSFSEYNIIFRESVDDESFESVNDSFITLLQNNYDKITTKKIYYIFVELVQNIIRHSENCKKSIFYLLEKQGELVFITGNDLRLVDKIILKTKLDKLNRMNKKEVDDMYYNYLEKNNISERGGAGIGILQIKRRIGYSKFYYRFQKNNDNSDYFYFIIKLKIK